MTSQIQKRILKKENQKNQNEKENKNAKRQNKRQKISKIDKQEFKNIKHDLNNITNYICLQDVRKKCHDNTTQHQHDQNKRKKETYEKIKDYLNAKKQK
jgi:hypothetical protein